MVVPLSGITKNCVTYRHMVSLPSETLNIGLADVSACVAVDGGIVFPHAAIRHSDKILSDVYFIAIPSSFYSKKVLVCSFFNNMGRHLSTISLG